MAPELPASRAASQLGSVRREGFSPRQEGQSAVPPQHSLVLHQRGPTIVTREHLDMLSGSGLWPCHVYQGDLRAPIHECVEIRK